MLSNGVDLTHPHQHARLYKTVIVRGGSLVSEYPIGYRPPASVIVEAGQRSGALAVVRAAGELGLRVYGEPGSIHSVTSKGVNELLRTGATMVASSVDHVNYQEGVR